ncbi:DinB superfamily protein [Chryseobacterium arachidis]|uniref:DinB superfamily protein n=1 Tax=Chryseobacterium arachidis TaxID=1416778 RepID=A0A1M4V583_9FLAO|nr:DinB family protein [Chryseobacterium arachidis]SHE64057.1 DinB superfamily protein [Chryseobacterium arachidis]
MKISSSQLISELQNSTKANLQFAQNLLHKSEDDLNKRLSEKSWSVLECLEHLNRYGSFYIPEINKRMLSSKRASNPTFSSGILGNYFAESMLPNKKLNAMKTFKSMNPIHSELNIQVIHEFIQQQSQLLDLLEKSKNIDLNTTKTSISISKLIKLKLGDTFRFIINHNLRHIRQAGKILNQS